MPFINTLVLEKLVCLSDYLKHREIHRKAVEEDCF